MDDPSFAMKYKKYKYKVKKWETDFKAKKHRIPSKHDIGDASADIRYAYKMYYKLKTSLLEETLSDVLFDDDTDGFDISNLSQPDSNFSLSDFNLPSQLSGLETENLEALGVKKIKEFEAEETNDLNSNAWGKHLNVEATKLKVEKQKSVKPINKVALKQEMFQNRSFAKRNPRKSLSRINSIKESRNSDSFVLKETLPDLETILAAKSLANDRDKLGVPMATSSRVSMLDIDDRWLKRCHSMNNLSMDQFESNIGATSSTSQLFIPQQLNESNPAESSFGFSALELQRAPSQVTLVDDNEHGFSDGIVENSEDESLQRSIRHIRKKRRIMTTDGKSNITQTESASTSIEANNSTVEVVKENVEPPKVEVEELPETVVEVASPKQPKVAPKLPTRRSTRKENVKVYEFNDSSENEDPFKCDNDSDKDPEFEVKTTPSPEKKVKKTAQKKADKSAPKTPKRASTRNKKSPKTNKSPAVTEPVTPEGNLYIPEIERIDNTPRYNAAELQQNTEIIEKYLRGEAETADKSVARLEENVNKSKLEAKAASGKLNENFVRLNIKKKIFVRGKKTFSYSKYKKTLWKQKKAAALSGPEMDMGGCDGGVIVCFNCNGVGHFAQKCPVKGDSLLEHDDGEEESEFPTIEEVNSMLTPKQSNGEKFIGHQIPEDFLKKSGILELTKISDNGNIEPVYRTKQGGGLIETPQEVFDVLKMFGHSTFRPGQETAVMRILSGQSTLVTLSTGSGKSLCYQLPAYLYSRQKKCCTLVISPLVSLMEDQVYGVPRFLNAQCLHTNQTPKVKEKIMAQIREGKLDVLLISPEAVISSENMHGFGSIFKELPPIAFACIDEAHCVSQWSHNFRPSYLMICQVLREKLNIKTILGLTATATQQTREGIVRHLGIPDGMSGVISDIPLPDNLFLSASRDEQRDRALLELLRSKRFEECNSIIIYCTRRDECERVSGFLRAALQTSRGIDSNLKKRSRVNWDAEAYHAGLAASRRRTIQKAFMEGNLRVVVATVAFGMGINKPDIRAVIHYNMPKNIESYVQEIGRAGRDGKPAHCHMFLDSRGTDQNELRRHVFTNSIDRHVIRKLLQKIFVPCTCVQNKTRTPQIRCTGHEVAFSIEDTVALLDIPQENISTLLCYLELSEPSYIKVLKKAYTVCKIISYGGPKSIRNAAQTCAPLAMAIAWDLKKGIKHDASTVIEFPVVEVASAIGWDSGLVKHSLKQLEWVAGQNKRSSISVQFNNLGFRLRSPGDLTDDELDETLDMLYGRVLSQERTELVQLQYLVNAIKFIALPTCHTAFEVEKILETSNNIKQIIREYFSQPSLDMEILLDAPIDKTPDDTILADVFGMISRYPDNTFTGRSLARIFHGCQSPNFPAVMWGRCKFWRSHTNVDFNRIVALANTAIVQMRRRS